MIPLEHMPGHSRSAADEFGTIAEILVRHAHSGPDAYDFSSIDRTRGDFLSLLGSASN
jgi:hypothetical protein